MKNSTQKKIYLSVTAGIGLLAALPASAAFTILDESAGGLPDGIRFNQDLGLNSVTVSGHTGSVTASNGAGNSTRVGHSAVTGTHTGVASQNNWTFDENGFSDNINDAPGAGTNVNTTTRNATSTTNLITDGADISTRFQTANGQVDVATDTTGINVGSRVQTKFGQTDTASITGGSTATRAQTATTQNDEIDDGSGNSNRLASTVAGTTRTVVGAGGTTAVTQTDTQYDVDANTRVRRNLQVDGVANLNGGLNVGAGTSVNMGGNRVQNIADGVADFDAVNFRQLNNLDKKLTGKINETGAVAAAFAQLGQAQTPGKSTFGIAAGGQGSKAGVALGWSHRPVTMKPVVIKASLGAAGKTVAGGIGATWEF